MKFTCILVSCVLGLGITTATAHAAQIIPVTNNSTITTISFSLTAPADGDLYVPIMADHTVGYFDRVDIVGYGVTAKSDLIIATSTALLMSSATVSGVRYLVPAGQIETFTLVAITTTKDTTPADMAVTMTKIPYWVGDRRTTMHEFQLRELPVATLSQYDTIEL